MKPINFLRNYAKPISALHTKLISESILPALSDEELIDVLDNFNSSDQVFSFFNKDLSSLFTKYVGDVFYVIFHNDKLSFEVEEDTYSEYISRLVKEAIYYILIEFKTAIENEYNHSS